jgi:hypothetical protein
MDVAVHASNHFKDRRLNMDLTLTQLIEQSLKDAAQAHHQYIVDLASRPFDKAVNDDAIKAENENWPSYYAAFVARRLAPYLTSLQAHAESCTLSVKDAKSTATSIKALPTPAEQAKAIAQFTAALQNCHDTGECES